MTSSDTTERGLETLIVAAMTMLHRLDSFCANGQESALASRR